MKLIVGVGFKYDDKKVKTEIFINDWTIMLETDDNIYDYDDIMKPFAKEYIYNDR